MPGSGAPVTTDRMLSNCARSVALLLTMKRRFENTESAIPFLASASVIISRFFCCSSSCASFVLFFCWAALLSLES